jgi:3-oxosteroid 1-dehydrogenase
MEEFSKSFDVVVVGSGGGGFCAALAALDAGRTAIVLESTELLGGSTAMSGGVLWVPNHPMQSRAGVEDSTEAALSYLKAVNTHDQTPLRWKRDEAFVAKGPEMVSFLNRMGIPLRRCEGWSDYHDELPGGCARGRSLMTDRFDLRKLGSLAARLRRGLMPYPLQWPQFRDLPLVKRTFRAKLAAFKLGLLLIRMRLTRQKLVSAGTALQGRMLQALEKAGCELRTRSPVVDITRDGSGRVTGVIVETDGKQTAIEARDGVIVAAGGFAHNQSMRETFGPKPARSDWSHSNPGDVGTVLGILMKIGAATDLMDNAIWIVSSRQPKGAVYHLEDIAKPHCFMVNKQGQRFTDEAGSYLQNGRNMYTAGATPGWLILDSRHRKRYLLGGAMPGVTPAEWLSSGYLKQADTLEELARVCGIDPAGLVATAQVFNRDAMAGVDSQFQRGSRAYDKVWGDPTVKPNPVLGSVDKPPFYAIEVYPGDVGTGGGVVIDEHARVLDKNGLPIEGLYATGNGTASIFGRTYPGAGASIAASFAFGYIGAKHATSVHKTHVKEHDA